MNELKKCERCRNSRFIYLERKCKFEMPQFPIEDEGECEHYDSRFIEYPLTIDGIDDCFKEGEKCEK